MSVNKLLLPVLLILRVLRFTESSWNHPFTCHLDNVLVPEGNVGETGNFPWVGVLRTHIHTRNATSSNLKIALTGIILVSYKYAIGHAHDISKIPFNILKHDSKAMFITNDQPWYTDIQASLMHPEYEFATYNTIALLELILENDNPVGVACLPKGLYTENKELYAIGFTDEKMLLEKIIYGVQNINNTLCEDFYKREDKANGDLTAPVLYQCIKTPNNHNHCGWESGMVLATNLSGVWMILGFGLRGPACSAPTRFISLYSYIPWIQDTIEVKLTQDFVPRNDDY